MSFDKDAKTRNSLQPGEVFAVSEEVPAPEGCALFLRLADGRGWVFDRKPFRVFGSSFGMMCMRVEPGTGSECRSGRASAATSDESAPSSPSDELVQRKVKVMARRRDETEKRRLARLVWDAWLSAARDVAASARTASFFSARTASPPRRLLSRCQANNQVQNLEDLSALLAKASGRVAELAVLARCGNFDPCDPLPEATAALEKVFEAAGKSGLLGSILQANTVQGVVQAQHSPAVKVLGLHDGATLGDGISCNPQDASLLSTTTQERPPTSGKFHVSPPTPPASLMGGRCRAPLRSQSANPARGRGLIGTEAQQGRRACSQGPRASGSLVGAAGSTAEERRPTSAQACFCRPLSVPRLDLGDDPDRHAAQNGQEGCQDTIQVPCHELLLAKLQDKGRITEALRPSAQYMAPGLIIPPQPGALEGCPPLVSKPACTTGSLVAPTMVPMISPSMTTPWGAASPGKSRLPSCQSFSSTTTPTSNRTTARSF